MFVQGTTSASTPVNRSVHSAPGAVIEFSSAVPPARIAVPMLAATPAAVALPVAFATAFAAHLSHQQGRGNRVDRGCSNRRRRPMGESRVGRRRCRHEYECGGGNQSFPNFTRHVSSPTLTN